MERNDNNDSGLVWAIIDSGTRRLVGKIPESTKVCDVVEVTEAVQLDTSITRLPGPDGRLATVYSPSLTPVDSEQEPVTIEVMATSLRYFSKMRDAGARYSGMYDHLMASLVESRARAANITPTPQIPSGIRDPRQPLINGIPGDRFRGR